MAVYLTLYVHGAKGWQVNILHPLGVSLIFCMFVYTETWTNANSNLPCFKWVTMTHEHEQRIFLYQFGLEAVNKK